VAFAPVAAIPFEFRFADRATLLIYNFHAHDIFLTSNGNGAPAFNALLWDFYARRKILLVFSVKMLDDAG